MRIHKGESPGPLRAAAALLFVALCAWVGAALYGALHPAAVTAVVRRVSVTESVPLEGIALRQEELLCAPEGAVPAVPGGTRVPGGTLLAVFADGETLTAPGSVLFFDDWDGLETLSPALPGLDEVSAVQALLDLQPPLSPGAFGRIVTGRAWCFAALAPAVELPAPGARCELYFDGIDRPLPARLLSVSAAEGGQRALLLRLTDGGADCLSLRKCSARLVLGEYSGLELPRAALRYDAAGMPYVHTVSAGELHAVPVELIYTSGELCVAAVSQGPDALREGSVLLVSGEETLTAFSEKEG